MQTLFGRPPTFGDVEQIEEIQKNIAILNKLAEFNCDRIPVCNYESYSKAICPNCDQEAIGEDDYDAFENLCFYDERLKNSCCSNCDIPLKTSRFV